MAKKLALLIGNSQYDDQQFTGLNVPEKDVAALNAVLQSPDIAAFDQVKTLLNQTRHVVEDAIANLFAHKHKDDLLLLYFSGHGLLDIEGDLYLALKQTKYQQPLGTALTSDFIKIVMNKSKSRRQVLILDCCHSGAFEKGTKGGCSAAITENTFEVSGYGREILTSSTAIQLSWEGDQVIADTDKSLFTHYLVEGLKTGKAANNGAEEITVEQLYKFVHDQVIRENPEMKPQRWVDKQEGALVIAKNPFPELKPKKFSQSLLNALEDKNHFARIGAINSILKRWIKSNDKLEVIAAENKLREMKREERDFEVREIIDELLNLANRQKNKTASSVVAQDEIFTSGRESKVKKDNEAILLSAGTVFEDMLKDGSKGLKMVVIPAGKFQMGSPENEEERDKSEGPQHEVIIGKKFAIGQFSVTFDEYDKYSEATGKNKLEDEGWGRGRRPVINVTWDDAKNYASWLSGQTGLSYRLPSEAEWEYAARANTTSPFNFGDTISTDQANYNGNYGNGVKGKFREMTLEVGSFSANDFELYDVHGNVWEWVADCDHDNYKNAPKDGSVWDSGACIYPVMRGGSWINGPRILRSAYRGWSKPTHRENYIGFRLARDL